MVDSGIIREQLRLFDEIAGLYEAGIMVLDQQATMDPVLALSQFVFGYAFERQGRSPAYAPIARRVIETLGASAHFWGDPASPFQVWDSFCNSLSELPSDTNPNPKNNPLCPYGYAYQTRQGQKRTSQPSVIEFAQQRLNAYEHNVVAWAKSRLSEGDVLDAHGDLCGVNGIGRKIASFFLRDVAWCFGIHVPRDQALLQPIDVWVRRAVRQLDQAPAGREAEWIVETAASSGASPEAVNAGMWYFGARIAGNEFEYHRALGSPEYARRLVVEYVERLGKQARAWKQEEQIGAHP